MSLPKDLRPTTKTECYLDAIVRGAKYNINPDKKEHLYLNEMMENPSSGGGSPIEIVDSLDSTNAHAALSANQGRILKEMVDNVQPGDSVTTEDRNKWNLASSQSIENTKELEGARGQSENLKQELDNRFNLVNDNLKAQWLEQQGTDIKVLNSLNGTTRDLTIEGNTLQNLAPVKKIILRKADGSRTPTIDLKLQIKTGTKVNVIYDLETNCLNNSYFRFKTDTGSYVNILPITPKAGKVVQSFTATENFVAIAPYVQSEDFDANNGAIIDNLMILEGDYTNKPVPAYFDGIKSTGEDTNKISILSCGKNLFPNNYLKKEDNTIVTEYSSSKIVWRRNLGNTQGRIFTNKLKSGTYTFSMDVTSYIQSANIIIATYSLSYNDKKEIKTYYSSGKIIVQFSITTERIFGFETDIISNEFFVFENMQIEEGTSATPYEPYKSDKKDISLPFSYGLKGLPSAKDVKAGNKIIQKVDRVVFDGSENWSKSSVANEVETNGFVVSGMTKIKQNNGHSFINNLIVGKQTSTYDYDVENIQQSGTNFMVRIDKNKADTVEKLKDYLKNNNLILYYELVTPVEYEIAEDYQLATNKDVTYIQSLNSIESTQKCKVPVDRDATTVRLINENESLINDNDLLKSENEKLTNKLENSNSLIDVNSLAICDLFESIQTQRTRFNSVEGGNKSMVELYVSLILRGLKTIEQVPVSIRPQVEEMLKQVTN